MTNIPCFMSQNVKQKSQKWALSVLKWSTKNSPAPSAPAKHQFQKCHPISTRFAKFWSNFAKHRGLYGGGGEYCVYSLRPY